MEKEVVIKIENVKKQYRLGAIGGGTLQGDLQSWWARIRGKEDPNLKIGQEAYVGNEMFYALNGINFEVYKGERLGIIGGNGAGKSTTLKLLSRVTAPTEGNIYIKGRISSMLEVGTGFHPELTGRENIYLNGAILGMSKAEVDRKIENIIEFSECRQFIDTPVKRYSSGMYVKLAFAVAAHLDSEILIMDEVLAVGDMKFQQKCLEKMKSVSLNLNRTVLYVSHNMNTIRQLCERCIVLDKGRVIYDGDVEEAINIYMDYQKEDSVFLDFNNYHRPLWVPIEGTKLLSAEFLNKEDIIFDVNERLNLKLKWKNLINVSNLCLRIEIWTKDDKTQCSYILNDFHSGLKDNIYEISLELNISSLVEDTYKMVYVFFVKDEYGNSFDTDIVFGLNFVKNNLQNSKLLWKSKQWGNIQMPTPIILNNGGKYESID